MKYDVIDVFAVGENTSVTIRGIGKGLRNGMDIYTPDGKKFLLLSVGLVAGKMDAEETQQTSLLVKGVFTEKSFSI